MEIPEENYLTFLLMLIISASSLMALRNKKMFDRMVFHPASVIHRKEYYRIITSSFVHNDFLHLIVNLLVLYVFCSGMEESITRPGRLAILLVVFNSLVGGHLLSLINNWRDITYSTAGASAITIGCMCSFFILHPMENHVTMPFIGTVPNVYAAGGYLVLMLIYSRKLNKGKIDYSLHLGGGIGGSLTALVMQPDVLTNFL